MMRLDQLARDIGYGLRQLRRNPAFSGIAIATLATLFYGFQPDYVPAVVTVSLVLLAVAALAVLIPARRASRIDPMIALQHE